MSIIEGAAFNCSIHDFSTHSVQEWNDHCFGNPEHTEMGSTICITCGRPIEFEGLPFHKLANDGSKNISLRCPDCDQKIMGSVKRGVVK